MSECVKHVLYFDVMFSPTFVTLTTLDVLYLKFPIYKYNFIYLFYSKY